jgi:hypothetical protein
MTKHKYMIAFLILGFVFVSIAGYIGSWLSVAHPGTPLLFPMVLGGQGMFFLFLAFVLFVDGGTNGSS